MLAHDLFRKPVPTLREYALSLTVCNPGPKWRPLAENRAALGFCAGGGSVGAIAQLGERVVRNDEVGGSIPPGSTTLRPSGYAWRSHVMPEGRSVVPGVALLGEDGLKERITPP